MSGLLDRFGITASVARSVHCLAHALLPAAFALGLALGPAIEWGPVALHFYWGTAAGLGLAFAHVRNIRACAHVRRNPARVDGRVES